MKINPADKKVKSRVKKVDDGAVVTSHRPLRGRNVFLHLLGWRGAEKFEENLKLLGASIEKCFSREVNVLITNQGIIKDYERPHSKVVSVSGASPTTPSPFNLACIKSIDSPQPESPGDAASRKPVQNTIRKHWERHQQSRGGYVRGKQRVSRTMSMFTAVSELPNQNIDNVNLANMNGHTGPKGCDNDKVLGDTDNYIL